MSPYPFSVASDVGDNGCDVDGEFVDRFEVFDEEFLRERRRRKRRLQVVAAVVLLALLVLTVLSSTFNVINIPSTPPTTDPVYLALGGR